ncbi:osteocalcin 2-like isoform X3 [Myiozetetes cayanensis]|uniref:osteocalcin 2-like isoform X3 n=1 Tax=Myiozetetes cayanensis TaxID=478635 RepID=UPI0021604936|nr:osteocalcin 2-like isoform X3 [Myiozetetes cayanensis]
MKVAVLSVALLFTILLSSPADAWPRCPFKFLPWFCRPENGSAAGLNFMEWSHSSESYESSEWSQSSESDESSEWSQSSESYESSEWSHSSESDESLGWSYSSESYESSEWSHSSESDEFPALRG